MTMPRFRAAAARFQEGSGESLNGKALWITIRQPIHAEID